MTSAQAASAVAAATAAASIAACAAAVAVGAAAVAASVASVAAGAAVVPADTELRFVRGGFTRGAIVGTTGSTKPDGASLTAWSANLLMWNPAHEGVLATYAPKLGNCPSFLQKGDFSSKHFKSARS